MPEKIPVAYIMALQFKSVNKKNTILRKSFFFSPKSLRTLVSMVKYRGWEKLTKTVPETIVSLSIMGPQLGTFLKPINTIVLWWSERFQGTLNWESAVMFRAWLSGLWGPNYGHPKSPRTSYYYRIEGFKWSLKLVQECIQ